MMVKQKNSVFWLFCKILYNNHIVSSWRDLFLDFVVDRFIIKNDQIPLFDLHTQAEDVPKTGVDFTAWPVDPVTCSVK